MHKIAICDDNQLDSEITKHFVDQYFTEHFIYRRQFITEIFNDPYELIESVRCGNRYTIYMLDVLMPETTGINVAKSIREFDKNAMIIFQTSYKEYSLDAFDVSAFGYLIKPLSIEQLSGVYNKAITKLHLEPPPVLAVRTPTGTMTMAYNDIVYIEHMNHVPFFHLANQTIVMGTSIRTSFEKSIEVLLTDAFFLKTHQSFAINLQHVKVYDTHQFIMNDGSIIPISQIRAASVRRHYINYLENKGVTFTDTQ